MGYSDNPQHVRADLFDDTGKWKHTVVLDYGFPGFDFGSGELWEQARRALCYATRRGRSGVKLNLIPEDWRMVVLEPYSKYTHPITVMREAA
jgi:hypothetical protein